MERTRREAWLAVRSSERQFSCRGSVPLMGVQRQSQRMERPTVAGSLSGGGC